MNILEIKVKLYRKYNVTNLKICKYEKKECKTFYTDFYRFHYRVYKILFYILIIATFKLLSRYFEFFLGVV